MKKLFVLGAVLTLLVCSCTKEKKSYLFDVIEGHYSLGQYMWYGSPATLDLDDSGYSSNDLLSSLPRITGGYVYDSNGNIEDRTYLGHLYLNNMLHVDKNYYEKIESGNGSMTIPVIYDSDTEDRKPRNVSVAYLCFDFQIEGNNVVFSDMYIFNIVDTGHLSTLLSEPKMEYEYYNGCGHVNVECKATFYDYETKSEVDGVVRLMYDYYGE